MPVPTRSAADPFAQLDRAWARNVGRRRHEATVRRWAAQSPALSDVARLDDFVTDDRDRRRRYVGAVVELVRAGDELAGEVLVQMLVPGLICLTSEMAGMFPRVDRNDLASDVVSVAWAQVNALASGRSSARTAGCILRNVRRDTIRWQRSLRPGEARVDGYSVVPGDGSDDAASTEGRNRGRARLAAVDVGGGIEAMFDQCETRLVLAEAARAGVIDERLAALLWHVVADDRQFKQAATDVGLSEPWAYQLRARTIPALRAHLADAA
jgi:hypothetical protein